MTAAAMTDGTYFDSPADEFHLACLLLSRTGRDYLGETLGQLTPDDFYHPVYGWLWAQAQKIHAGGGSVTKRALLAAREAERGSGGFPVPAAAVVRSVLEEISGEPVYVGKLSASVRVVKQAAQLRRLTQALDRARDYAVTAEDYSQAVNTTFELLQQIEETDVPTEVVAFSELVTQFEKAQAGGVAVGEVVPSPWPQLDDVLGGGFKPGRMYVVGGRPNSGKSIVGINCAQVAAELGIPALVVSSEMSALEVTERVIAGGARTEYREITRRSMSTDTYCSVAAYTTANRNMPLFVLDKPNMTVEYAASVARTTKRRHGLGLAVFDYAQLLEASDKRASREQQVSHISHALKNLARELAIPVIVLAQLNKDNVRGNRRPTVADFRESDALSQDPDAAVLLHHELTPEGEHTGWVTLIVDKNRFGPKADVTLPWRAHQARVG
jgi:replicative DNA helicase